MTRLPAVLSAEHLPLAELQAARLDGEVFGLAEAFTPIDEIASVAHRARAVHTALSDRLIAEQHTAAWIWGVTTRRPVRDELCVALGARVRHSVTVPVREVVIEPDEIADLGGCQVTTPLRTIVDLARFSADFGELEEQIVAALMSEHGIAVGDCLDDLEGRRNLPNKRRAVLRLSPMPNG
jgi:hypothetical protein